ncbi:MAG TPA: selenophosphate synthase [Clostridia bacterium]|nr:selenophosphate synthase [Clostridia bacterium]HPQ46350.1 selenophosphate synthase [Clostridia bacterium]HRX41910.1 selenophosphate synthase [Clostridia bacterium]
MIQKFRDISIIDLNGSRITIACDSCSGVGMLPSDIVESDGFYTGYRTAFVPLAETLAIGATPIMVVNNLSVAYDGYGRQLIDGIRTAAEDSGLTGKDVITGSTEENFIVPVTSVGITVVGRLDRPLPSPLKEKCHVYLIGMPFIGSEVLSHRNEILDFETIRALVKSPHVYDVLPVGSKGILYEINEMTRTLESNFIEFKGHFIDLKKSAGPASCAIVACSSPSVVSGLDIPVTELGYMLPK